MAKFFEGEKMETMKRKKRIKFEDEIEISGTLLIIYKCALKGGMFRPYSH